MATFSLLVPVYNEAKTIDAILDHLATLDRVSEFVVVNDGSSDGTADVLKRRLQHGSDRIRVVTHTVNQGKGTAIRSGLSAARSEYLVIQDADTEYDPADLDAIFDALERKAAPVVFGSRFLIPNPTLYPTYLLGNKMLTFFANLLGGGTLTDSYTCYKGMSLADWRSLDLRSSGFEIEAEISMKCLVSKRRILELPIRYRPRSIAEGKKIRPWDAVKGALTMIRYRFWRPRPNPR